MIDIVIIITIMTSDSYVAKIITIWRGGGGGGARKKDELS